MFSVMSMPSAPCFICDKHRQGEDAQGGVLWEDDLVYAGHIHALGVTHVYSGYLMVEPKRHVRGLADLTDEEASRIGILVSRLARVLVEAEHAEHVYSFVYGDAVPHLHVHVAPRYAGTPAEYWGARLRQWPDAPVVDEHGMRAVVGRLRAHLPGS
jgi:diadenosine tetraphosphate (Ap4A) HIT family hydrolase